MKRITGNAGELDHLDWREGSGGTIEIFDIVIGTERQKGRGRELLRKLFDRLPSTTRVFAITRIENETAQQFYEHCGFTCAGVLRRFYANNNRADAVMYVRSAGGPI